VYRHPIVLVNGVRYRAGRELLRGHGAPCLDVRCLMIVAFHEGINTCLLQECDNSGRNGCR
jgi:hypothetical protein